MRGNPIVLLPDWIVGRELRVDLDRLGIDGPYVEHQHGRETSWHALTYQLARTSASAKKKRASRAAFSSESDAWIAFRSLDSANSLRTVPASASAGSVAPIALRSAATAPAFSRIIGT